MPPGPPSASEPRRRAGRGTWPWQRLGSWREISALESLILQNQAPTQLTLAETSGPRSVDRRLRPSLALVEAGGYRCEQVLPGLPHVRVLRCRAPEIVERLSR